MASGNNGRQCLFIYYLLSISHSMFQQIRTWLLQRWIHTINFRRHWTGFVYTGFGCERCKYLFLFELMILIVYSWNAHFDYSAIMKWNKCCTWEQRLIHTAITQLNMRELLIWNWIRINYLLIKCVWWCDSINVHLIQIK
jgi:hypothetical protein